MRNIMAFLAIGLFMSSAKAHKYEPINTEFAPPVEVFVLDITPQLFKLGRGDELYSLPEVGLEIPLNSWSQVEVGIPYLLFDPEQSGVRHGLGDLKIGFRSFLPKRAGTDPRPDRPHRSLDRGSVRPQPQQPQLGASISADHLFERTSGHESGEQKVLSDECLPMNNEHKRPLLSIESGMFCNTVQFKTSAPLEDIVGTTSQIHGAIQVDPGSLKSKPLSARFEVDLATLETGIALRDTHMRDQYLHTDKYPKAVFTLDKLVKSSSSELKAGTTVKLLAEGSFELHGVQRPIRVPVEVTYLPESKATMGKLPGNLLRIQSSFEVRLADYNIERPQMVILKVGELAHVALDAFASDADQAKMSMWMEQMQKMMAGGD